MTSPLLHGSEIAEIAMNGRSGFANADILRDHVRNEQIERE